MDGEDNVLITSALPYCNNVPHLGMPTVRVRRALAETFWVGHREHHWKYSEC